MLGVFLQGLKTTISPELVKSGVEKMTYQDALAKAMDIENAQRTKHSIHQISELTSSTSPTADTKESEEHPKKDQFDIEELAQKVAAINVSKDTSHSNTTSTRGSNRRGRGRGRGGTPRRGGGFRRGTFRNQYPNPGRYNNNQSTYCFLCKQKGHMVDSCYHNPFNQQNSNQQRQQTQTYNTINPDIIN